MGKKKGKNTNNQPENQPSTSNNAAPQTKNKQRKKKKQQERAGVKDVLAAKVQGMENPRPKYTVESLLERAEKAYESFEFDTAADLYTRALELQPNNTTVLDLLAELKLDLGDEQLAKELLLRSVNQAPDEGYSKYMYLGQLSTGKEAINYFRKGIEILKSMRDEIVGPESEEDENTPDDPNLESLIAIGHTIATALCSIAEIYMTDQCFDEDAEEQCEKALLEAIDEDDDNIDVYQTMANFRLSQCNQVLGREAVAKVLQLMRDLPEDQQPPFEFRMVTAKLLYELAEYEKAETILEALVLENDEEVDVLFLLGLCCKQQNDFLAAYEHLQTAHKLAVKSEDESEMIQEIQKELEYVKSQCSTEELAELEKENEQAQETGAELDDIESDDDDMQQDESADDEDKME